MKRYFILFFACSCVLITGYAQNTYIDSLSQLLSVEDDAIQRIRLNHQLFGATVNNLPDEALSYAHRAYDLSAEIDNDTLMGQSMMNLTHAYFVNNHVDSAKFMLLTSIPFYEKIEDYFMVSACYRNLAVIGEANEQPDTSLGYLEKCLAVLEEHPDSSVLADVYLSQGFAYRVKGYYELSLQSLLNSLRIVEQLDNINRKGYVNQNIGITLSQSGRKLESLGYMNTSAELFLSQNNLRAAGQSLNNIGILHREMMHYDSSFVAHQKSLNLALETEQYDVVTDVSLNLAKLYSEQDILDSVLYWVGYAKTFAIENEDQFALGAIERYNTRIDLSNNNLSSARSRANRAEALVTEYVNPQEQEEAYLELAEIFEELDDSERALKYWKLSKAIQDSLFTLKQDQQIEELNLIYKTEKKDAEIRLLNKTVELDQTRKKALAGGLLLLLLTAGSIVYALIQRSRKNKRLFEQEKQLEVEKRRATERELEFKQKELTAKVLQLASKNEFLQSLEQEVSDLKSSVDSTVSKTTQRISRMISYDASDDREWEQFGKEFSSIHQDFLDRLKAQYGSFSKSEVRLIALLKMNLSSKDIANTLRISDDGVKKARYRLRKKMALDSALDIQEFLLNY